MKRPHWKLILSVVIVIFVFVILLVVNITSNHTTKGEVLDNTFTIIGIFAGGVVGLLAGTMVNDKKDK